MYQQLTNGEVLKNIAQEVEAMISPLHKQVDERIEENQFRVLQSYQAHKVSDSHFIPTTGYGYDDMGRDTLARNLYGGRVSLAVGFAAMLIAVTFG